MKSQRIPIVLTREEVNSLIAIAEKDIESSQNKHQRFNSIRNVAVLRLFWSTGLRVQELANLDVDSIFPEEKRLKVRNGKFGNNDYQPVTKKETWEALERYLPFREQVDGRGPSLFLSFYGQRILPRQIARDLKDYGKRAGIKKNVHPHTLRHSFGTEYYRKTNALNRTKEIMRHRSISSTEIYLHTTKERLAEGLVEANL